MLAAVEAMRFELEGTTYDAYVARLAERGAVIEERIKGTDFQSPSVQLRITPLGDLELLSTHDQLLGGKSGQTYLGCVFPANPEYAPEITREAAKVGARLAKEGVIGRFALDFVVVRNDAGEWKTYAIEINLRKGGTTHPFLTLQFLTDGTYDPETATFTAPSGTQKYFVASDRVESDGVPSAHARRPLRHRRAPRAALLPVAADRRRAPHDGVTDRSGTFRVDRGGRLTRSGACRVRPRDRGVRRRSRRRGRAIRLGVTTTVLTRAEEVGCRD